MDRFVLMPFFSQRSQRLRGELVWLFPGERGGQALGMHRVMVETGLEGALVGSPVEIGGEEARHALRVKRVRAGERVELMDGRGTVASGVVESAVEGGKKKDGMLIVRVESVRHVERIVPRVEVWTAVAKSQL